MRTAPIAVALGSSLALLACGDSGAGSGDRPDAAPTADAAPDAAPPGVTYDCGVFAEAPTWTVRDGFRAVVVADADDGLSQPVAVAIAGGGFLGKAYVVNQGGNSIAAVDTLTGDAAIFAAAESFPTAPSLLTTIVHDAGGAFDGDLYVGDQGGDGDGDSRIYRIDAAAAVTGFTAAPGPGLDDIYGMAFSPGGDYPAGLYVTGDTDGGGVDWGVFDAAGVGADFSELAGGEGVAVDRLGTYGGGLFASRPAGGGYAGDDTITRVRDDGTAGEPVTSGFPGVHAVAFTADGPFDGQLVAASWSDGTLVSVAPDGERTVLASGLALTNYDGNILEPSPDGRVLFVADRLANRLVCIEPL